MTQPRRKHGLKTGGNFQGLHSLAPPPTFKILIPSRLCYGKLAHAPPTTTTGSNAYRKACPSISAQLDFVKLLHGPVAPPSLSLKLAEIIALLPIHRTMKKLICNYKRTHDSCSTTIFSIFQLLSCARYQRTIFYQWGVH